MINQGKKPKLPGREKKILFKLIIMLTIILLLFIFFAPGKGILYQHKLEKEIALLTEENTILEEKNNKLRQEIEKLKNDKEYLEEIARTKYGLLKKNELLFRFNSNKKRKK